MRRSTETEPRRVLLYALAAFDVALIGYLLWQVASML